MARTVSIPRQFPVTFAKQPERPIYWRMGKDSGVFYDLKTLKGACARLRRVRPDWTEIEAQFDRPVGSN